jgi:hypothetical protein
MEKFITIEELKDFDTWKAWKHGEVELEPLYRQEKVSELLDTQRGNCYVAVLDSVKDTTIASRAVMAPEPWEWKQNAKVKS